MTLADRWLLPDGVEELLPEQALQVEALRRRLLDLYASWGYQLVIPPLIEFTESLLVGQEQDIDLQTFKVVDQLSGRTMGIRADITPQTARIDAHSLNLQGPARLCYAGSVLHTRPKSLLASRSPIQVGAELYGDASLNSDIEVICLMLETLRAAGISQITLDLGHVGIYQSLVAAAGLSADSERALFDALQRKAGNEVERVIRDSIDDARYADMMRALSGLNGDRSVLDEARRALVDAPEAVAEALDQLAAVAEVVAQRMADVALYFDLSELRGYHYHTGLVFAALAPGHGQALANGGRYDHIGEAFGRARPATGFNTDLKALLQQMPAQADQQEPVSPILAPALDGLNAVQAADLWLAVQVLRERGEVVISALSNSEQPAAGQRELVWREGEWRVSTP